MAIRHWRTVAGARVGGYFLGNIFEENWRKFTENMFKNNYQP